MSEKIVQLNEEVIKGQLKELAVSYTHLDVYKRQDQRYRESNPIKKDGSVIM